MISTESGLTKGFLLLAFMVPTVACGGGSSTSRTSRYPQNVTVKLAPATSSIGPGAQQQFTATVSGTDNQSVTWSVDTISNGSAGAGTISGTGMYTAPLQAGTHTV